MTTKEAKSNQTLRQCAEERLKSGAAATQKMRSLDEANRLLHEIQGHQIELEMQNEELRRTQAELETAKARYFDLYDLAPVGYLTISDKGLVLTANRTAATLLGVAQNSLVMQPFSHFILPEDQGIYSLQSKTLMTTGVQQAYNISVRHADGPSFWAHLQATLTQDGGCRITLNDITEFKRIEEVQAFLAQTSSRAHDEPFFEALARYLSISLQMDFVCIDRLEGDGLTARTLAVWCDGHFEDNVTYALKDTPCGDVVGKTVCCFPASVCQFFPRDQVLKDLRAESYAGVTLWGHTGQPIGLIAVIGHQPLTNQPMVESLLKLVAIRASAELERLDAEDVLRAREELHRTILHTAMDGFWLVDRQGCLLEVNETYCRMSGYSEQELLAMRVADLEAVEAAGDTAAHIQNIIAKGEDRFVSQHRRKDGSIFDVEVSVQYRPTEGGHFFGFIQDITDRRQAESTKAWLSSIVESSHDAIISRAFDGTILSWNKGAEQMFGYAASEMLGNKIDVLFPAEQADGFNDFDLLCHGAKAGHSEPSCQDKDGQRFTVLLTQSPIINENGEAAAASVIMRDISSHREMERQLLEANKNLERKVAERTASLQLHMAQLRRLALELTQTEQRERQRLANVLHNDLQQLLVAAGLRLERLNNIESNADKRKAIQQVETLIGQAVKATRSLATDLRPPVLNSANLVKSLHWLADWLWKRFDLSLKFSVLEDLQADAIPDEDIVFLFDTARELCFNIVKHAHVKEGRMTLQRTAQGRLQLSVADYGVGIDLERQNLPVSVDGGLGLGAIRDRLALIGGELHINSAVGKGFSADIILPYALTATPQPQISKGQDSKAVPAADRRQTAGLPTGRNKIRVMLVDDHTVVRDGLKMILLDEADIDVVGEAGDGEKAFKMAGKLLPDVIIMDVNMPKMNGIEATKLIKQDHPEVCVVALSINDDPGTINSMLEAGASTYLNKSGSADEVCEVIRVCLRGKPASMPTMAVRVRQ